VKNNCGNSFFLSQRHQYRPARNQGNADAAAKADPFT
jgi:hypothetical protein